MRHYSQHTRRHGARLVLRSEIDLAVRDQLTAPVLDALAHHHPVIDIDLRRVTFVDYSGIGALMAANDIARANGQALNLTHPRGLVRTALDVTGVLFSLTVVSPTHQTLGRPGHTLARVMQQLVDRSRRAGSATVSHVALALEELPDADRKQRPDIHGGLVAAAEQLRNHLPGRLLPP